MRITVVGAGHGGQALAGYLATMVDDVVLYNRTESVVEALNERGNIEIQGCVSVVVHNVKFTSDIEYAIKGSEVIMVCIPSNNHEEIARKMTPFLKKGQVVVLNPGRTMGAFLFSQIVNAYEKGVIVAETDTFLLTARKVEDGVSKIFSLKKQVYLACCRNEETEKVYQKLKNWLPMLKKAESIAYTSMANIGVIFHPLPALLNIARIECENDFLHYKEGISPAVATLLEKLDKERVLLSRRLNHPVLSAKEWIERVYGSKGDNLYQAIQNTGAYDEVIAPREISTRYIFEDITTGIVPMYCMLRQLGEECPIMELIINLANELFNYDFVNKGRCDVTDFLDCVLNEV